MKKKLRIDQLRVQSFVTSEDRITGGGTLANCTPDPDLQTAYSCLAYITCHAVNCALNSQYQFCDPDTTFISNAMSPCVTG